MRICSKNPNHRRLGAKRCEMPGCGALVIEVPDNSVLSAPAGPADTGKQADVAEQDVAVVEAAASQAKQKHADSVARVRPQAKEAAPPLASGAGPSASETRLQLSEKQDFTPGIDWPWGFGPLFEYLAIGRDPSFSQLAAQLAAFPNVSRRHAEIRRRGTSFVLRDLGSKYGTSLDDHPIPPQQDVDLRDGVILRLGYKTKRGSTLTAKVRLA